MTDPVLLPPPKAPRTRQSTLSTAPFARTPKLADNVLAFVRAQIESGRWRPGDRLPNEAELCRELGVSRTPVREAVKVLEAAGVLAVRQGSGTFVRQDQAEALAPLLTLQQKVTCASPTALMELRRLFERACAELAAAHRTEFDLEAMRRAIDELRQLARAPGSDPAAVLEADLCFHRAVYRAAHNELIELLANFMLTTVAPWIGKSLTVGGAEKAVRLHEIELAMIESQNPGGARECYTNDAIDRQMEHWRQTLEPR